VEGSSPEVETVHGYVVAVFPLSAKYDYMLPISRLDFIKTVYFKDTPIKILYKKRQSWLGLRKSISGLFHNSYKAIHKRRGT
jgi:hypothetical protein